MKKKAIALGIVTAITAFAAIAELHERDMKLFAEDASSYECADITWGTGIYSTAVYSKASLPSTATMTGAFTVSLSDASYCYMNSSNANAMKFGKSGATDAIPSLTLTFNKKALSVIVYACMYGTDADVNLSLNSSSQTLTTNYDDAETSSVSSNENNVYGYRPYAYSIASTSIIMSTGVTAGKKRAMISKLVLRFEA